MASLSDQSGELCRKDTGSKKLRKWSRGHQFVVCGGVILMPGNPCTSEYLVITSLVTPFTFDTRFCY